MLSQRRREWRKAKEVEEHLISPSPKWCGERHKYWIWLCSSMEEQCQREYHWWSYAYSYLHWYVVFLRTVSCDDPYSVGALGSHRIKVYRVCPCVHDMLTYSGTGNYAFMYVPSHVLSCVVLQLLRSINMTSCAIAGMLYQNFKNQWIWKPYFLFHMYKSQTEHQRSTECSALEPTLFALLPRVPTQPCGPWTCRGGQWCTSSEHNTTKRIWI